MRKLLVAAATAVAAAAVVATPVSGITKGGVPDGDDHPYVGLMVSYDESDNPMWRCSGTLISPTVFLTAGHCTDGAASVGIWFDTHVDRGIPNDPPPGGVGYPWGGYDAIGTPHTYPDYFDPTFYVYDLGLVVLDVPYDMATYGELPSLGAVDQLAKGRKGAAVTTVGYGLQFVGRGALPTQQDLTRYRANSFVVNTKGAMGTGSSHGMSSMLLSGDASGGGTCFGDSGGPTFAAGTNTVLAVTSFGMSPVCGGVGGVYRIDHESALEWISGFLGS